MSTQALRSWRFDELVEEGLSLGTAFAPEWTNHNPSDPGVTLVELLAYFTEVLAYRLGRVTPQARLQFLRLIEGARWTGWRTLAEAAPEAIDRALQQAVARLGQSDCAVTPADFERLAIEAAREELGASAEVHARCVAGCDLETPGGPPGERDLRAHTSIVLMPRHELDEDTSARLCRAVRERLRPHCLLGTRVHVIAPVVLHAGLGFRVALVAGADWHVVRAAIAERLRQRFGPWSGQDPFERQHLPGMPLHLMELTELIDATEGVDHVEDVTLLALSRHAQDLREPSSFVGVQVGVHSTLAVDAWLGVRVGQGSARLVRDDAGRLATLLLNPWEQLRLHLVPEAVRPLGRLTGEDSDGH
jgi:hypothetical protein